MDWIDWHFVTGMWAGAASVALGGLLMLGWLRALRRSEPRLEEPPPIRFPDVVERHNYYHVMPGCRYCNLQPPSPPQSALDALTEIQAKMSNVTEAEATAALNLDAEFPQPTSQQPSAPTTGRGSGPSGQHPANRASTPEPRAKPGSVD